MDMNFPQELFVPASAGAQTSAAPTTEYFFSEQLSSFYDRDQHAMWLRWRPTPRPNFNPELLQDLSRYCQFMAHSGGAIDCHGERMPLEYAVLASKVPGRNIAVTLRSNERSHSASLQSRIVP